MALEGVLLSMDVIKNNLEKATDNKEIETNAKAMERLANAYNIIKNS